MNRLKQAYEWAGLSRRQFARALGVSHTTVQNWEVEGMPDFWVTDVCEICDVSRHWLRTGESEATQGDIDEIERVLAKLPIEAQERLRPQLMAASKHLEDAPVDLSQMNWLTGDALWPKEMPDAPKVIFNVRDATLQKA